jgi:hypothetical protein
VPLVRYPCKLCPNTANGELQGFGRLCVDCADDVIERMFALLELPAIDRRAVLARMVPLGEIDPTRPEPINWRRYLPRTRAERRRDWKRKGLVA